MATIAEAADHLFIDERTFKRHLDEGNITRRGRGLYHLDDCRREYLTYLKNAASGRAQETNTKRADAGTQKDVMIARRYEIEIAEKLKELLPRAEVLAGMSAAFARVRAKLLAIPSKLAPVLLTLTTASQMQEKLNDAIHEVLEELAGTIVAGVSEGEAERKDR